MADANQGEATKFFRGLGFHTYKIIDLRFEAGGKVTNNRFGAKKVFPAEAGHFDMILVGGVCSGGVVEVKAGEDTRFPFAKVRDEQRDWYRRVAEPKKLSSWIFFDIGERARADWADNWLEILTERRSRKVAVKRDVPRLTVLMPFGEYLKLEETHLPDSKSLPYEYVATNLAAHILGWNKGLSLPEAHPFKVAFSHVLNQPQINQETEQNGNEHTAIVQPSDGSLLIAS